MSELKRVVSSKRWKAYWMAATWPKSTFLSLYKSHSLQQLNVRHDCSEMQNLIEFGTEKDDRLSLYMATQLAYGAMKIHSYQVDRLFNDTLKLLNHVQMPNADRMKPRRRRQEDEILDIQELPDPDVEAQIPQDIAPQFDARIDHCQLEDVAMTSTVLEDPDARLNFGRITEDALWEFFGIDERLIDHFEEIRMGRTDVPIDINGNITNLDFSWNRTHQLEEQSIIDPMREQTTITDLTQGQISIPQFIQEQTAITDLMQGETTIPEPIQEQTAQELLHDQTALADPIQGEIPKTVTSDMGTTILEQDTLVLPEITLQESHHQTIISPELQPVQPAVPEQRVPVSRKRPTRVVFDDVIMLQGDIFKQQLSNFRIHTQLASRPLMEAALSRTFYNVRHGPMSCAPGGSWGRPLMNRYEELLDQLETARLESVMLLNAPENEIVRQAVEEGPPELPIELSNAIPPVQQDNLGTSANAQKPIDEIVPQDIPQESYHETHSIAPQLPDISKESTLENQGAQVEESTIESPEYASSPDKTELFENIKSFWQDGQIVSLHDVLRRQNINDRGLVVQTFMTLLKLHKEKRITLRQTEPLGELWILQ